MNSRLLTLTALLLTASAAIAQPPAAAPPAASAPEVKIEPTFFDAPEMTFAGTAVFTNGASGRIPELWGTGFHPVMKGVEADGGASTGLEGKRFCYGLELYPPEMDKDPNKNFTYMACFSVTDSRKVPLHMVQSKVPAARYAVFKVPGSLQGLGPAFKFIYGKWLPQSGFQPAYPFDMERYDMEATKANNGILQIEILVPIAPRK